MMLALLFVGLFLSPTLWGTLFPVPRASGLPESFVEQLSGAMKVTTLVKGAHGLMKMFSMYRTLPGHKDPVRYFQDVALWVGFAGHSDRSLSFKTSDGCFHLTMDPDITHLFLQREFRVTGVDGRARESVEIEKAPRLFNQSDHLIIDG
jgi:hypothetical protein